MAPLSGGLAARWRTMSPREQVGVVVLGVVVLGVVGYRTVSQGRIARLAHSRAEWLTLRQQVEAMRAALPNVEEERRRIPLEVSANEALDAELTRTERALITTGELGRLVGELTKQAEGLPVAFEAIKQRVKDDPERPEATLEVAFTARYEAAVNYLRRVERLSPFLRITKLEMAEPKDGAQAAYSRTTATLVALMTPSSEPGGLSRAPAGPPPETVTLSRNPFGGSARAALAEKGLDLKVTGVTYRGPDSTAIINNEVVRVGDTVDHQIVQQIRPDGVVVSDGTTTHTLPLEQ